MPVTIGGSGPITGVTSINTTVSDTELGYLDGVTSAIQSQINTAGGLVKITDQSFSAASAVNVNNCFTSTYENYRIVISNVTGSTNLDVNLRLRVSGSDASGANYSSNGRYVYSAGPADFNSSGNTSWGSVSTGTGEKSGSSFDLYGPALAQATYATTLNVGAAGGTFIASFAGMKHSLATAYDGFSLITSTGTMSGNVRVYGYRN